MLYGNGISIAEQGSCFVGGRQVKGGAGGKIGVDMITKAAPGGHTIAFCRVRTCQCG